MPNDEDINKVSRVIGKALNVTPNAGIAWNRFGIKLLRSKENNELMAIKNRYTGSGDFSNLCQALLQYWKNVKATEGDG